MIMKIKIKWNKYGDPYLSFVLRAGARPLLGATVEDLFEGLLRDYRFDLPESLADKLYPYWAYVNLPCGCCQDFKIIKKIPKTLMRRVLLALNIIN